MHLSHSLIYKIWELGKQNPKRETCGYILHDRVFPCPNLASDPAKFTQFPADVAQQLIEHQRDGLNPILYHTHVEQDNAEFSIEDVQTARLWDLPILMVHTPSGKHQFYDPNHAQPYFGREWNWLTSNCYNLIQDFYKREYRIQLKDFYMEKKGIYNNPLWDGFSRRMEPTGFVRLFDQPIRRGDLILMTLGSHYPNHLAVVWDASRNEILHHLADKLSKTSTYGTTYRKATYGHYRHRDLFHPTMYDQRGSSDKSEVVGSISG